MPTGRLERILIVEDEPDIQAVARLALEGIGGFRVLVCGSGEEALARAGGFSPDLVLMDVTMPGMDGPSTLRALRARAGCELIPVIFMTATARTGEIARLQQMGALDVVLKPFDPMTLPSTLKRIWETRS